MIDKAGFWLRLTTAFRTDSAPEIAVKVGLTKQAIYRWQGGEIPGLDVLTRIANESGRSLDWLVFGDNAGPFIDQTPPTGGNRPKGLSAQFETASEERMVRRLSNLGVMVPLPILGTLNARGVVELGEPARSAVAKTNRIDWTDTDDYERIPVPAEHLRNNRFLIRAIEDCPLRSIRAGQILICEPSELVKSAQTNLWRVGNETWLRNFSPEGRKIMLSPVAPDTEPVETETSLGWLVGFWQ